jgi:hypothetical protein
LFQLIDPVVIKESYPDIKTRSAVSWPTEAISLNHPKPKLRVLSLASYFAIYTVKPQAAGIQIPPGAYTLTYECALTPYVYNASGAPIDNLSSVTHIPFSMDVVLQEGVHYHFKVDDDVKKQECRPASQRSLNRGEVCGYFPQECSVQFEEYDRL